MSEPAQIADDFYQLLQTECQLRGLLHWSNCWADVSALMSSQPSPGHAQRFVWYRDALYSHADAMFNSSQAGQPRGAARRALLRLGYGEQVEKLDVALRARVNEHVDLGKAIILFRQNVIYHTDYRPVEQGEVLRQLGWSGPAGPHAGAWNTLLAAVREVLAFLEVEQIRRVAAIPIEQRHAVVDASRPEDTLARAISQSPRRRR